MNKYLLLAGMISVFCCTISCEKKKKSQVSVESSADFNNETVESTTVTETEEKKKPTDFVPKGYVVFETVMGDLNKDGQEDCVLIIKGTDKTKIITDENRGVLDRNRRGIIILFNTNDNYELALKNYDCLSSENEDGGVYFAPELSVTINKGNLVLHYGHGRYGYWKYTFRAQNNDFELIGYDSSDNFGPIVNTETSINFLIKKKVIKTNTNEAAEASGQEVFKKTVQKIVVNKLFKLSEIKDFDEFDCSGD